MAQSEHSEMTHYRALSLRELGMDDKARALLKDLKSFASKKLKQKVTIDYFATSLPLLLVFEEDLQKRNQWEAIYLMALAEKGLGNDKKAQDLAGKVLTLNAMHSGAKKIFTYENN
jgi:hypothetical protein